MSWATTDDNIKLYFEEAGSGTPIVFVHEFGGDWRSWEPQMRHFARRHRCITFSARGFTPSDIPKDVDAYSQRRAVQDILCIMDAAGIDRAARKALRGDRIAVVQSQDCKKIERIGISGRCRHHLRSKRDGGVAISRLVEGNRAREIGHF